MQARRGFSSPVPPLLEEVFAASGWRLGDKGRLLEMSRVLVPSAAGVVLDELYGIQVEALPQKGPLAPLGVKFDPRVARNHLHLVDELSIRLRTVLTPVADVGNGVAILLMADSGEGILLGYSAKGVFFAGTDIWVSLENLLTGGMISPIVFNEDPDDPFWEDDIREFPSYPQAWRPGPEGLREFSP